MSRLSSETKHHLLVYLLIALAVLGIFHGLLTDQRIAFGNDAVGDFYHWRLFLHRALHETRLPEWNPYVFMGQPFVAATQTAVYYPLNLILYRFLPVSLGMNLEELLHLIWFGWGTAFLLGAMRTRALGMLVGGLLAAFAPIAIGQLVAGHLAQLAALAWTPWALAGVELLWDRRRLEGFLLVSLAVPMSILGGHPQFTFYLLLAVGYWFVYRGLMAKTEIVATTGCFIAALALAGLLGAAQLLPTLGISSSLTRAGSDYAFITRNSEPPVRWLGFLFPATDRPTELNENLFAWWGGAWALAIFALGLRRDRRALGFALLGVVALLLAGGSFSPAFKAAHDWLPGFSTFRMPSRILVLVYLALAVIAGRAFAEGKLNAGRSLRPLLLVLLGFGLLLALLAFVPDTAARWAFCIDGFVTGKTPVADANGFRFVLRALTAWANLMLVVLLAWLWGCGQQPKKKLIAEIVIILVILAQAMPWAKNQFRTVATDWLERPSPLVEVLQRLCAPGYRYLVLDNVPLGSITTVPLFNRGTDYRLRNLAGSDAVVLRGFQGLFNISQGRPPDERALVFWANRTDHFLLDFLAVRYVVAAHQPAGTKTLFPPGELDPVAGLYERPTARRLFDLPAELSAIDTGTMEVLSSPLIRAAVELLRTAPPNRPLTIIADASGSGPMRGHEGMARFLAMDYGEGWAEATVESDSGCFLSYAENLVNPEGILPEWLSFIDGVSAPAPRVINGTAVGLWVPAGTHTVRFEYWGPWARLGRWVSFFLGFLPWTAGALVLLVRMIKRRRAPEPQA